MIITELTVSSQRTVCT